MIGSQHLRIRKKCTYWKAGAKLNHYYSWTFIVPTLYILFQEFENFHNLVKCLFSIKLLCGGLITFRIIVYEDNDIIVKVLTVYLSKVPPTTGPVPGTLNISSTWNTDTKRKLSLYSVHTTFVNLAMIHNNVNNTSRYGTLVKRSKNWWNVLANTADQPQWGGTSCINILCG